MGKPTICIGEIKVADQLRSNCEADQRLCFRYSDSTIPLSKSKIQASYHLLCLYSSVFVGPVRKPHCWFSHETAQMLPLADTHPIPASFAFLIARSMQNLPTDGPEKGVGKMLFTYYI